MRSRTTTLLVLTASLATPYMQAQQTLGGITGAVTDASGAAVANATVTIVEEQTKLTRSAKTNSSGVYQFVNMPIGSYAISVVQQGFDTQNILAVLVQADRTASVNATLAVGGVNTAVTVTASSQLNAVDTTNGYILDKGQIDAVPLATGSFTQLATLSPGVNAELLGGTGANTGLGNQPIWANGQRDTSNTFLLNGVDSSNLFNGKSTSQVGSARVVNNTGVGNTGAGGVVQSSASIYLAIGQALPTPPPEMIQEIRVNTSMYDAQQGSTSGAHIDMSTASGTNNIHGTTYWHRGTDWLNAAPFFFKRDADIPANQKVPQLHRSTEGLAVGGPLIKDKVFGFAGYQHIHVADNETGISRLTVPTGLTDDRSAGSLAAVANANFNFQGSNNAPITGAQISPVALYLMQYKLPSGQYLVPSANPNAQPSYSTPDNASIAGTSIFKSDQAVADLDWNASAKDTLSAKYYYQHDPTTAPFAYSNVSGFPEHVDSGSHVFSVNNTTLVRPNLSVTGVIGFAREKAYGYNDQLFTAQDAGINAFGSTYFPGISIIDDFGNSSPNNTGGLYNQMMNIGPGAETQGPFTGVFQNRLMPSGSAILSLGKHTLSTGGSYAYTQLNTRDERTGKGIIASSDFSNFLQGNIAPQNTDFTTTSFMLGNANRYYRANQIGAYAQDKYQIRSNLSITAGVRYDWNGGLYEKNGKLFNFDPSGYAYDENSGTVTSNGFIIASNNKLFPTRGVSKTTLTGRQWGFSPRVGAAWEPQRFNNKVVVRSGFGMYYDRGELFSYLSPGYAAGEVTGGPFGVNQTPPFVNTVQCPNAPAFISPCSGTISLSNPWGTTPGTPPSGNPADITNYLPSAAAIMGGTPLFTIATYDRANTLPYTFNYSLDVQWQATNDVSIQLGYIGNVGRHLVVPIPFNQAQIASSSNPIHGQQYSYGYTLQSAPCPPGDYGNCAPANLPNGQPYLSTYEGGNIDLRVPYVGYSAESEAYRTAGISAYNALQFHLEKRMSRGLQVGFSYTYSHALDEQSALGLFYNGNNPQNLRDGFASSDFDRTHVVNFEYAYQVPDLYAASSWEGKILDRWELRGVTVLQSGQPYSMIDYSGAVGSVFYGTSNGVTNPIVPLAPGCTPKNALTGHSGAFDEPALKAECFTIPLLSPGDLSGAIPANDPYETNFTNRQRNIFRQTFQKRADASLVKTLPLHENYTLRYTLDVFNLTNTTSFDIPLDNVTQNAGFNDFPVAGTRPLPTSCDQNNTGFYNCGQGLGVVQRTIGSPRQIQMSLQLNF